MIYDGGRELFPKLRWVGSLSGASTEATKRCQGLHVIAKQWHRSACSRRNDQRRYGISNTISKGPNVKTDSNAKAPVFGPDKEVKMSDRDRAQIRYSCKVMGREDEERPSERHLDRGKSSVEGRAGSRIGEPENSESVRAISNQGKLPGAITGRQNRAFFGAASCMWGGVWRACSMTRIIMI